jgi:predicted MFS family arabinose efflux permease
VLAAYPGIPCCLTACGITLPRPSTTGDLQSLVPEDKRARVMSYYTMAFFGAAPFGSLLAGALAHQIGASHTVILTGAFCVAGSLWFTFELPKVTAVMRPIYQEMGLLPARDLALISDVHEPAI